MNIHVYVHDYKHTNGICMDTHVTNLCSPINVAYWLFKDSASFSTVYF